MATLVLSTLACRDRDRDETASRVDTAVSDAGDEARGGAAEARDEVREGARSLDSYTWAERDDFRRDVRQRLTDIDGQIEQLSNDARSSGGTVDDQSMANIRRARKAVDRNVAKLDEATENSWPD